MAQTTINLTDRLLNSSYQAKRDFINYYRVYDKTTPSTVTSATQSITVPSASAINWARIYFTRNSPSHGIALHQVIVDGEVAHAGSIIGNGSLLSKALFTPGNHNIAFRFKSGTSGTTYGDGTWAVNTGQLNQTNAYLVIDYNGPDTGGDAPPSAVTSTMPSSLGGAKCGNTLRFSILSQSPGVYHKARVGISGVTYIDEIIPKGATTFDFEIPYGWQQYIAPNATARYSADGVYARLFTYSDQARTTQIGYVDAAAYIAVSDDNYPVITEFGDTLIPEHDVTSLDFYIQKHSRAQLTALGDANFNASIVSYRFYSGTWSETVLAADLVDDALPSAITPVLSNSGTVTLSVEATDTRNRKTTSTATITVTAYADPIPTEVSVARCLVDGTPSTTGAYIKVVSGLEISSLQTINAGTLKTRMWAKGATAPEWSAAVDITPVSGASTHIFGSAAIDTAYFIEVQAADLLATTHVLLDVGTALALISGLPKAEGVGIGKIADTAGILDIAFSKGLMDGNPLAFYPVGSIYMSTVSTNPGDIFGGTWSALATGKALVGVDPNDSDFAAGVAGGSKTGAVTGVAKLGVSGTSLWVKRKTQSWTADGKGTLSGAVAANSDNLSSGIELDATVSTLQPYLPVYIWTRTA